MSIRDYFSHTWRKTLDTFIERTIKAGSCGVCRTAESCKIRRSALGTKRCSTRIEIILHLAHQGIPGLERVLEHDGRVKFHRFIASVLPARGREAPFNAGQPGVSYVTDAICEYTMDYNREKPELGQGEDGGQEAEVTNVWKVWKEATRGTNNGIWDHKWYPQDSNEPNTQSWGIHYLRAWGWVFLDAGTFEIVQHYRRRHDAKA